MWIFLSLLEAELEGGVFRLLPGFCKDTPAFSMMHCNKNKVSSHCLNTDMTSNQKWQLSCIYLTTVLLLMMSSLQWEEAVCSLIRVVHERKNEAHSRGDFCQSQMRGRLFSDWINFSTWKSHWVALYCLCYIPQYIYSTFPLSDQVELGKVPYV